MANLDVFTPNYKRARDLWPDAPTLKQCHEALAGCVDGNAHGMVEYIKSFIESVCLTILGEFGKQMPSSTPSTTELLVAALRPLGLQNSKGASKLDKVLSAFNKLTDALADMRNDHGPVAHGKDAFLDAVTADHARAFLHAGDAILSVLLNALEGKEPDLTVTREPYERFAHLNARIDQSVGVEAWVDEDGDRPIIVIAVATGPRDEAIELRVEPSRLLYGIDRAAYIEVLKTSGKLSPEAGAAEQEERAAVFEAAELKVARPATGPSLEVVPEYVGRLATLRSPIEEFLRSEGWQPTEASGDGAHLIDSILATADQNLGLDWKQREPLKARLKIACKRVLVRFGFEAQSAEKVAARFVSWMHTHVDASGDRTVAIVETDRTES